MASKVVRLRDEDFERVNRLSGLPASVPFALRLRTVLIRCDEHRHMDGVVRKVVREELERLAGLV